MRRPILRIYLQALTEQVLCCCPVTFNILGISLSKLLSEYFVIVSSKIFKVSISGEEVPSSLFLRIKDLLLKRLLLIVSDLLLLLRVCILESVFSKGHIIKVYIYSEQPNWLDTSFYSHSVYFSADFLYVISEDVIYRARDQDGYTVLSGGCLKS